MKKTIKNLIVLSLVVFLGLTFIASEASALTKVGISKEISANLNTTKSFNNDSQDFATVRVSNYTKNPGCSSCWSSSVTADAGDTISVAIYYHNTGSSTATGTRIKLSPKDSSSKINHTFSGSVFASNVSTVSGSASVNLSSAQTISYTPGSILWYPDQATIPLKILLDQSGTEIFGNGLLVGDIIPGWSSQGSLVIQFKVGEVSGQNNNNNDNLTITTNLASGIGENGATLNGYLNLNSSVTYWFEYGTNSNNLNHSTTPMIKYINGSVSNQLSNLLENTNYYFRLCAQNSSGQVCGSTLSFSTNGGVVTPDATLITTTNASNVTENSAKLNASLETNSTTSVYFEYGSTSSNLNLSTSSVSLSSDNTVSKTISGLSQGSTYYFRACAQNSSGQVCGSVLNFITTNSDPISNDTAPSVNTNQANSISSNSAILNATFSSNGLATNVKFKYGTNSGNLNLITNVVNYGLGNNVSVSQLISNLQENTTYYFKAVAENNLGSTEGNLISFTTTNAAVITSVSPIALTNLATKITKAGASLNGVVINNSNLSAVTYFEYGPSIALGLTTSQKIVNPNTRLNLTTAVGGLNSEMVYYYRLVAKNSYGTSQGEILTFKTLSPTSTTSKPTVVATTTVSKSSILALKIETENEEIMVNENVNFKVTYKNIDVKQLDKVILQVVLPKEVNFMKASSGKFSAKDNTLTLNIGKLASKEEGEVIIKVKILSAAKDKEALITNASMVFTRASGIQENVFAYVVNNVVTDNNSSLAAASIFGDNSFLPNTLVEWILVLAGVFALVFFGRKFYLENQKKEEAK